MVMTLRLLGVAALVSVGIQVVAGHGQMNFPPSTRQGLPGKTWPGALSGQGAGGFCEQPNAMSGNPGSGGVPKRGGNPLNGACMLFSQPNAKQPNISIIPGEPTLNDAKYRTNNVNVSSGDGDWTRKMPWRDPGMAPVLGSGCGVAGGGIEFNGNGGWPPTGMLQGQDPLSVLKGPPNGPQTMWTVGSTQTVAMGVWANHGGGYNYRLCKNVAGKVTEECFQQNALKFVEDDIQWLQHINGTKYQIPMTKFKHPTTGAEWARIPFPTCGGGSTSGSNPPDHGFTDGTKGPDGIYYCPHGTEYPEPLLNGQRVGLIGFGYCNNTDPTFTENEKPQIEVATRSCTGDAYHSYNIVDRVLIPEDLEPGDYLLSWRWDCEQTHQIWQNCADVRITK